MSVLTRGRVRRTLDYLGITEETPTGPTRIHAVALIVIGLMLTTLGLLETFLSLVGEKRGSYIAIGLIFGPLSVALGLLLRRRSNSHRG